MVACAPASVTGEGSGGSSSKGGSGGNGSGGDSKGGSGGSSSKGGSGGSSKGGSGGSSKGGSGGSSKGGSGGSSKGGSGGSSKGGSGGSSKGGSGGSSKGGSGGSAGAGGTSTGSGGEAGGGAGGEGGTGGGGSSGNAPAGWWKLSDWGVDSPDWHGCVWAGSDNGKSSGTSTISPNDFTGGAPNGEYHVEGKTAADEEYESVGFLGFNISEEIDGDAKQCEYHFDPDAVGPPGIKFPSSATGIAINWSQGIGSQFRIQINGPNGSKQGAAGADERWCATIKDAGGPSFVKFTDFYTACWFVDTAGEDPGKQYNGEPIDAIVFTVPGNTKEQPFDFTINGFAPGTSIKDAPGGGSTTCTPQSGTIGGSGSTDVDYARVKVKSSDCGTYIIQNNNWGNASGSDQTLSYNGNSFKVTQSTGSATGQGVPASFPSVFQGRNGQVQNGAFSTEGTDNMPIQVSKIQSVQTQFTWSGGKSGGDYNASYDVWFASSPPTPGSYDDAISGFVMVWFYKPGSRSPIGGSPKTTATIDGKSFDVWVGPRGGSGSNSGAPVVSYVAKSQLNDWSFDLNLFIKDAAQHGIQSSWYLTDVFAGFEIWTGADGVGLEAKKVSIAVK